ncbi:hypothetical protein RND81_02G229600 [Saponaria officinalis]|uniref:Uncharacterized protein n=1 Tax=Saponaria officinalis TaxID=3572 RepID=A0AAW1MWN4_SAPOF
MSEKKTTTMTTTPNEMTEIDSSKTTMTTTPNELTEIDSSKTRMTTTPNELTKNDSSKTTMATTPNELTENDSSKRDSTTCSIDGINLKSLSDKEYVKLIISMLGPPEPKVEYDGPPVSEKFAKLSLAYYKETTNQDYEFSRIRSMAPFPPRQGCFQGGTHLNFFARPKGSESGPEYLFYGIDLILHPPHIVCPDCDDIGRYELDDDDDEY